MLLSIDYIKSWLKKYFRQATKHCFLFYTGHGHNNGNLAAETTQNPDAD
jgi:hypothetical protein